MNHSQPKRLLLVEDDGELAALTQEYLQKHGFLVDVEADGLAAAQRIPREQPDLVILDIMLPGQDGFAVCRSIRKDYPGPVLMLTARDEDIDQLLGLELGADDYIAKPVHPRVLLARLHAILRRTGRRSPEPPRVLEFDGLRIDRSRFETLLDENRLDLGNAEFDLLWLLASHSGIVMSRDDILRQLRGFGYDGSDRSIDLRISRLRKKLGDSNPANPRWIRTIRGSGYLFLGAPTR